MLQFASGDSVVHVLIWNVLGDKKKKSKHRVYILMDFLLVSMKDPNSFIQQS